MNLKNVTPCYDCGDESCEIDEFKNGDHAYSKWEVFPGHQMVLCDFCDADFGSYQFEYWGFSEPVNFDLGDDHFINDITNPQIEKDWCCSECKHRLAFLKVLKAVRTENE